MWIHSSHNLACKLDNVLNMSKMTAVTDIWNHCYASLNADGYTTIYVKYLIIIVKTTLQGSSEMHISVYNGSRSSLCFCVRLASMSCSAKSVKRLASGQHCVKGPLKMLMVHIQGLIKFCPLSLYVSVTNTLQEQPNISAILLLSF